MDCGVAYSAPSAKRSKTIEFQDPAYHNKRGKFAPPGTPDNRKTLYQHCLENAHAVLMGCIDQASGIWSRAQTCRNTYKYASEILCNCEEKTKPIYCTDECEGSYQRCLAYQIDEAEIAAGGLFTKDDPEEKAMQDATVFCTEEFRKCKTSIARKKDPTALGSLAVPKGPGPRAKSAPGIKKENQ